MTILFTKESVKSYAHDAYSLQSYCKTYKDPIFPLILGQDTIEGGMALLDAQRPPQCPKTKCMHIREEGEEMKQQHSGRPQSRR